MFKSSRNKSDLRDRRNSGTRRWCGYLQRQRIQNCGTTTENGLTPDRFLVRCTLMSRRPELTRRAAPSFGLSTIGSRVVSIGTGMHCQTISFQHHPPTTRNNSFAIVIGFLSSSVSSIRCARLFTAKHHVIWPTSSRRLPQQRPPEQAPDRHVWLCRSATYHVITR